MFYYLYFVKLRNIRNKANKDHLICVIDLIPSVGKKGGAGCRKLFYISICV